jgi:hypothetical protein
MTFTMEGRMTVASRFLLVLALALPSAPASAAWRDYLYADLGVAKEFPVEPKREATSYRTPVIGARSVPAVVFSGEEDHIIFRMTVADLRAPQFVERSGTILSECIELAEQEGTVLARMPQRVEDGTDYRVYGHMTSVDLFGNRGRKQTNCFYTKGRLIKVETVILPEHGEPNSAMAIRFTSSLRFRIDGTSYTPPDSRSRCAPE